jgi:hypothetical protein
MNQQSKKTTYGMREIICKKLSNKKLISRKYKELKYIKAKEKSV